MGLHLIMGTVCTLLRGINNQNLLVIHGIAKGSNHGRLKHR